MASCLSEAAVRAACIGGSTCRNSVWAPVPTPGFFADSAASPTYSSKVTSSLKNDEGWANSWNASKQRKEGIVGAPRGGKQKLTVCEAVLQQKRELAISEDELLLVKRKAQELGAELRGTTIFLVGMMGSGKTTVGRILADALEYCFFDSDSVVEQAAGGASVSEIFQENGEEAFRDAEAQAIAQLSSMCRLVVATGGGAVIRPSNWGRMRDGITVWLNVPVEALALRLATAGMASRPILSDGQTSQDLYAAALEKLSSIFEERQALYRPADAEVSLQGIATEMGSVVHTITPGRIALQVLNEIDTLIQRRKMEDNARRQR